MSAVAMEIHTPSARDSLHPEFTRSFVNEATSTRYLRFSLPWYNAGSAAYTISFSMASALGVLWGCSLLLTWPTWLKDNIDSAIKVVGAEAPLIFQWCVFMCTLAGVCLMFGVLYLRAALRNPDAITLVNTSLQDAQLRNTASLTLRRLLIIGDCTVLLGLLAMTFWAYHVCRMPYPKACIVAWIPVASIPVVGFRLTAYLFVMALLSQDRIQSFCSKFDVRDGDVAPMLSSGFWTRACESYKLFSASLVSLWCKLSPVVLSLQIGLASLALPLILSAWLFARSARATSALLFSGWLSLALVGNLFLLPLAECTELCQNSQPGQRSLRNIIADCGSLQMSTDAHAEYARFVSTMTLSPVGIYMPGFGLLTRDKIIRRAFVLARMFSLIVPLTLGFLGRRTKSFTTTTTTATTGAFGHL